MEHNLQDICFNCFRCMSTFPNIHKLVQHLRKCDNVIRAPQPDKETHASVLRITVPGLGNSGSFIRTDQMTQPNYLETRRVLNGVNPCAQNEGQQQGQVFPVKFTLMPVVDEIAPERFTSTGDKARVPAETIIPIDLSGRKKKKKNPDNPETESNLECYFCRVSTSSPQKLTRHFQDHCLFSNRQQTIHERDTQNVKKTRNIMDSILSSQRPLWSIPVCSASQMPSISRPTKTPQTKPTKTHIPCCSPLHPNKIFANKWLRKQLYKPY